MSRTFFTHLRGVAALTGEEVKRKILDNELENQAPIGLWA